MSREVTEAHYLHERSGLEAVLRPPVPNPTALCWVPKREELLVCNRAGELISVDPVLGTRTVAEDIGEAAKLHIHEDRKRWLVVSREGRWRIGTMRGETLHEGRHGFLGGMDGFLTGEYAVLVGDEDDGRRMVVLQGSEVKARVRLPSRVVPTVDASGKLLLCRSTPAGLLVIPLDKSARFPKTQSTVHRLRRSGLSVLGFTTTGICIWGQEGGVPQSMRLPDLTAGDLNKDGTLLGLGTRSGAVALARLDRNEKRIRPDLVRAFNQPVTSVAFSSRGKWLATGAEGLRIWSWED